MVAISVRTNIYMVKFISVCVVILITTLKVSLSLFLSLLNSGLSSAYPLRQVICHDRLVAFIIVGKWCSNSPSEPALAYIKIDDGVLFEPNGQGTQQLARKTASEVH